MKVLYIYRNQALGFSIAKVFRPIEEEMRKYAEVDSIYLPEAGAMPWQLWKNIKVARYAVKGGGYDIVHITGAEYYLLPFLKGNFKVVVTVHDLGFFTNFHLTLRTIMLYLLWIRPLNQADRVTCISEKTKEEVQKYVAFASGQICTIHNPVSREFAFKPEEFNTTCPLILQMGTKPNKNLNNTVLALRNVPHRLRIIGNLNPNQKALLEIYHVNYTNASNLTDEEIVKEYEQCDIINFPSFYEGFGMPIIEGQAVGRVVITSNLSPMKDIANGSAVLIDPVDPSSILLGYKEAIRRHTEFVELGLDNVKRFRVEEIAKQYFSIYEEVVI